MNIETMKSSGGKWYAHIPGVTGINPVDGSGMVGGFDTESHAIAAYVAARDRMTVYRYGDLLKALEDALPALRYASSRFDTPNGYDVYDQARRAVARAKGTPD